MRLTKKQLRRLIKESLNGSQNPDNTLEKIFLREAYYCINYLLRFSSKFDFFLQQIAVMSNDYDSQLFNQIRELEKEIDSGSSGQSILELNQQIDILDEVREQAIYPGEKAIESLRFSVDYYVTDLIDLHSFLIVDNANKLGLEDSSFAFGESGEKDGEQDLYAVIDSNYNSDNPEKIDIIQYIIDTWNKKIFFAGNSDPEAKAVLEANGISDGLSTYEKIDSLIALLSDSGTLEKHFQQGMQIMTSTSRFLRKLNMIDGQINNELAKHKDKYENSIEELIYILKNERPNSYKDLIRITTNPNSDEESFDRYSMEDLPPF